MVDERTPEARLSDALLSMFRPNELRIWLGSSQATTPILKDLPGETCPPSELAWSVALGLKAHGLVNEALFGALARARPERGPEIMVLAKTWEVDFTAPRPPSPRSDDLRLPGSPAYDRRWYVNRPDVETDARLRLREPGSPTVFLGPRGIGKSTVMNYLLDNERGDDDKVIHVDLNSYDPRERSVPADFFAKLMGEIAAACGKPEPAAGANYKVRLSEVLLGVLPQVRGRLILVLDAAEQLAFDHRSDDGPSTAGDLITLLRAWCAHGVNPAHPNVSSWRKLRLMIAISMRPEVIRSDVHFSSLTALEQPIEVGDFSDDQVASLACKYDIPREDLGCLEDLVGRHPYLLSLAMYKAKISGRSLRQVIDDPARNRLVFGPYFRAFTGLLKDDALKEGVNLLIRGGLPSYEVREKLWRVGVVDDAMRHFRYPLLADWFQSRNA